MTMPRSSIGRRRAIAQIAGIAAGSALASSCVSRARDRVRVYSSIDDPILRPIVDGFTRATGIAVDLVGDTEATKTTGLVQRVIGEKNRPAADVWWSNECLGTVALSKAEALEPYASPAEDPSLDWGPWWRGADWYGLPARARAIAYAPSRWNGPPPNIESFADAGADRLRLGMARPAFGTTRTHVAALLAIAGEDWFAGWLTTLKAARVVLYDGNSAVVRGVARGEIDAGLTDTDDVHAGRDNGWELSMSLDAAPPPAPGLAIPIPSTIGLVRGAPRPRIARAFIDHVLGEEVERMLVEGPARHAPRRASLAAEFPDRALPPTISITPDDIELAAPRAVAMCESILG